MVDYEDGSFEVTCEFAVGSRARGCFLVLSGDFGNYSMRILRDNRMARHQHHVMPLLGNLVYSVYDWEEDDSIGTVSVPVQFLTTAHTSK